MVVVSWPHIRGKSVSYLSYGKVGNVMLPLSTWDVRDRPVVIELDIVKRVRRWESNPSGRESSNLGPNAMP